MGNMLQYGNVGADQVSQMLEKLKAAGSSITTQSPNEWEIEGMGITAHASYFPLTQTLTVQILSKPWIVSTGTIDKKVREALGQA